MKAMKKTVGILSLVIMLLSQIFTPLTYAATGDNEDNPVIPEVLEEQEADIDEPENPVEESGEAVNPEQIIQDVVSGGNTVVTTGGTTQEEVSDEDTEESIKDNTLEKTDESEGTVTIENNMLVDAVEAGFGGELEYNSEEVRGYKEHKNVKVEVYAETGAFEETPSLLIEPLESEKETDIKKAILTHNEDTESLDDEEIEQVAEEKITEVVAFDIKFLDKEKKEVQPREGMVRVEFNFTENKTLEETDEHEIKVYHLDNKDEKGNEIKEIEKMEIDEPEMTENNEEQILTVIGEKFSIYTIVQQVREEGIQATTEDQLANFVYGEISIARPNSLSSTEYPIEGLTIMDRNLGAISNDITDSNSYGYQYQWGNNYGFITSLSKSEINKDNNKIDISGKTGYAGNTFIYGYNTWMNENTGGFWGGENDIAGNKWGALLRDSVSQEKRQGPCPKGWHVPSAGERGLLIKYWGTSDTNAVLFNESNYLIEMNAGLSTNTDKFKQDFKLPIGNSRLRSDARNDGNGKYWSSTPRNGGDGYAYYFNLTNTKAEITTSALAYTNGYQVRCFKNTYTPGTLHTITFNFNDGKGSTAVINVLDGMTGVIPETPVKPYNKFLGWFLEGEETEFDFENTPINEDIELHAKWRPIRVVFNANGGTFENQQETKTINYEYVEIPWMAGTQTQPDTINVPGAKNILLNLTVGCYQNNYVTLSGKYDIIKAQVVSCPSITADYRIYGNTVDIIGAGYVGYGGKAFSMPENPVQEGKGFKGWFTEDGEKWTIGYDSEDVTVYAHWGEPIATFIKGEQFNEKIKKLSNKGENITYDDPDENILEIKKGLTVPNGVNTIVVSTIDSDVPIEVWFDNGTLYYYSKEKTIYLNEDSTYMFYNLKGLQSLDLSDFNIEYVKQNGLSNIIKGDTLTELNLSGWNFSNYSAGSLMMNLTAGGMSSLRKINLTNTVFSGSISYGFGGMVGLNEIILDGIDTSYVTDMSAMFNGCSSLTSLDLSNFKIQNVTSFSSMFWGASSLITLNLDGWDLSKISCLNMGSIFGLTTSLKYLSMSGWQIPASFTNCLGRTWGAGSAPLEEIDVTNWDLSNTTNLQGLFADSKIQRIKGLETWNTSNITNMSSMFQNLSNLRELDLSNFNTENVTDMSTMFLYNSKLETIYVSDDFNTSKVLNSSSMFQGDTLLVGGNGTVFNEGKIDKEYAVIDDGYYSGYFTAKPYTITYELNNGTGENRTGYTSRDDTFTLNNPTREGYTFLGWTGSNLTEPTVDVEIVKGTKGNLHFTANWKLIENTVVSTPSSSGKGRVLPSKQKATTEEQEHNAADEKAVTETESNNESENNQEDGSLSQSEDNSAIYTPSQSVTVKQQVRKIASKTLTRGEVAVMTNVLIDVFPQLLTDKQEIKDNNECISFADEASFTSAEKSAATRLCKLGIMGIHGDTKEQLDKFEAKKNATNNEFTMVIDRLLSSNNDKEISMLRNALKDRKNNEEGVKFRTVLESFIKIKNAIKK